MIAYHMILHDLLIAKSEVHDISRERSGFQLFNKSEATKQQFSWYDTRKKVS